MGSNIVKILKISKYVTVLQKRTGIWDMGYGNEAALAVLDFGFSQTNLEEVFAAVNPLNIASEKILIRIGMIYRKKIEWPEQGLVNLYSLNKCEYNKNGFKKLTKK